MGTKALIWDRGLYLHLAQKLGEKYDKVWYYYPQSEPYPTSQTSLIGEGLPEVERVYEFWPYIDKADIIVFFDCYDGQLQHFLWSKGYNVFGSLQSEILEMDKVFFYQFLLDHDMPVPPTYRAVGLDDLIAHLEHVSGERWLKTSYYRGDFETHRFHGMGHLKPWIDDLTARIGGRSKDIEVLVQSPIEADVEIGYDGFCVHGDFVPCMSGYETKDKGYIGKFFDKTPKPLEDVNKRFSSLFRELGYQGHFSTEIRVTKDGKQFFIDPTLRAPSPPSEVMCEMFDYADAVHTIAMGKIPVLKNTKKYCAEIILRSEWNDTHELFVDFPARFSGNVKLKNHYKRGNGYIIVPNKNAGYFGAVAAIGDTLKEAQDKCLEVFDSIEADELDGMSGVFDNAEELIEKGKKHGIEL